MKNITPPRTVSFETALQNLAAKLTGRAAADLPKTQEALVQYMAENVPSVDELAEAVTQEVLALLEAAATDGPNTEGPATGLDSGQKGSDEPAASTDDTPEGQGSPEGGQEAAKPKRTRKTDNPVDEQKGRINNG